MWLHHSSSCSLLVALSLLATIAESSYYNNPASNSNAKGSNFQCTQEGYFGDPQDCAVYYRCVDYGNGGPLVRYKFECGPGTVFSSDQGDICTYPDVCGRPECGGTNEQSDKINDIDSNNPPGTEKEKPGYPGGPESQPSPTPTPPPRGTCPSCGPSHESGTAGTTPAVTQVTGRPPQGSSNTAAPVTGPSNTDQASSAPNFGTECTCAGFLADPDDCTKFYRCVDAGNGRFQKYDFNCGDGTVWDPNSETCNHPWAANRVGCRIPAISHPPNQPSDGSQPTAPGQGSTEPTMTITWFPGSDSAGSSSGTPPSVSSSPVSPSQGSGGGPPAGSGSQGTTSQAPNTPNIGTECTCAGFLADPDDCTKFYRCVDVGNGRFQKYDFNCGDGTVWDPNSETCNHPWAANRVGCRIPAISHPPNQPSDGSQPTAPGQGSTEPTMTITWFPGSDSAGSSSGTPPSVSSSPVSPSQGSGGGPPAGSGSQGTPSQAPNTPNIGTECICAGFLADPDDCSKFYRCVDTGNGKFQRYDFNCGDGTVWDPNSETCNHPWAANRVGCRSPANSHPPNQPSDGSQPTAPGQGSTEPTMTITWFPGSDSAGSSSGIPPSISSSPVSPSQGSGGGPPAGSGSQGTTSQAPNTPNIGTECTCAGFLADPDDCSKFYRCVDRGNGKFQRYDFNCGDGTVWDPNSETCNYPWAANRVGCKSPEISNPPNQPSDGSGSAAPGQGSTEPTTTNTSPSGSDSNESSSVSSPSGSGNPSQGGDSTVSRPAESTTAAAPSGSGSPSQGENCNNSSGSTSATAGSGPKCSSEGFMADPKDCQKFYRCAYEGTNTLKRYEFTCGPGTVWDQKLLTCTHPWQSSVPQCQSFGTSTPPQGSRPEGSATIAPSESPTNAPSYEGSSMAPPAEASTEAPSYEGTSTVPPAEASTEAPSYEGSSMAPPDAATTTEAPSYEGSTMTPTDEASTEAPSYEGSSTAPPDEATTTEAPSYEGSSVTPTDEASTAAPSYEGSTVTPAYEASTEAPSYEGSTVTPADEASTEAPSYEGSTVTPAYEASTEAPSYEGSTVTPTDEASTEAPSYEGSTMTPTDVASTEAPSYEGSSMAPPNESATEAPSYAPSEVPPSESATQAPPNSASSCGSCPKCKSEGFFPNEKDCTKFYRCVKNARRGYHRFEFSCGPGTAWDQGLLTCNYIHQVASCKGFSKPAEITTPPGSSSSESSTSSSSSASSSYPSTSSSDESSTSPSSSSSASGESSGNGSGSGSGSQPCDKPKPPTSTNGVVCNQEGFYANPNYCGKFYRCVSNGNGFSVFHFDCAPGTIFDPSISTCNHASAVYPPRKCDGGQSGGEAGSPGANQTPACQGGGSGTTQKPQCGGNSGTNAEPSGSTDTSTNSTPDFSSTASAEATTGGSAETATEVTNEGGESATQEEQTTIPAAPVSEEEATQTEESSTEQSAATNAPPPAGSVTCPIGNLTGEQIALVCPTGFRRHPKYCNIFYQCTSGDDMSVKILSFHCPDGTIFDEKKIECVPEEQSSKPCNGVTAGTRVYRRVEESPMSLVYIEQRDALCPSEGYYPHNHQECSNVFYKCKRNEEQALQGYLYKCPQDFVFWPVSRRCERRSRLPMCSNKSNYVNRNENYGSTERWQLPEETYNRSARKISS